MTTQFVSSLLFSTPNIHVAKKELSYPLYGADFDPLNSDFLLVGGGGGSSSTGVPNRISLLDTSRRDEIKEVSDIELVPDEDSVTTLAVADSDSSSLLAYAGINSSQKDQKIGKNEHLRSFRVSLPQRRNAAAPAQPPARTQALARTAMFRSASGPKNECYQRVLRLSPPISEDITDGTEKPGKRLKKRFAAIASGLAVQNEVLTFPAQDSPTAKQAISRVSLEKAEAEDVDLINTDDVGSAYVLAYATSHELYLQQLGDEKGARNAEPVKVHETATGPVGRSRIRSLRFIGPRYLLVMQNRVNRSGVELIVFKISKDYAQVQQVLVKYLKHMKQSTGMEVCTLSKGEDGSRQFVIAIAGQDSSIQIHTLDWVGGTGITAFRQFADLIDVHDGPVTRMAFSTFVSPQLPISGKTPPQYVKLVSTGVDKNVIVQTLPLQPTPATGTGKLNPRYVLIGPSQVGALIYSLFMGFSALIMGIVILLTFLELRGAIPPIVGGAKYLPVRWQRTYPYAYDTPGPIIPENIPQIESIIDKIKLSEATPIIEKMEEMVDRVKLAAVTPVIEQMQKMQDSVPSAQEVKDSIPSAEQAKAAIPSAEEIRDTLASLVSQKHSGEEHSNKAVIVRDLEHLGGEVSAELKHEAQVVKEGTLKKWETLSPKEQKTWKQKLKDAGQWTEKQGETVLKGVFFGQLAGIVGEAIRG